MKLGPAIAVLPLLLSTCCSESSPGVPPVAPAEPGPTDPTPLYSYRVVRSYPHDRTAFTQGLLWADGWVYESTGLYGASSLRRVDLETGQVKQRTDLDPGLFGEGLALTGDRLVQLTWRSGLGLVYDRKSFAVVDRFTYDTEGWGLTADDRGLVMSDGTSTLYLLDPETYAETGQLAVHDERGPVSRLNELEYVEGEIWANVWMSDRIARISPRTGRVTGWIELGGLLPAADRDGTDVLNGIAYDRGGGRLFVTGKLWPRLFEVSVVSR
ncbi:MAG: glutaminyl-peptide cyclotransferase [Candidatus Latescibacterota bacterium]